ncbi:MAG: zinc-dependent peptidase [Planctomycetota bacterium]
MLVSETDDRANRKLALAVAFCISLLAIAFAALISPWFLVGVLLAGLSGWLVRRPNIRRLSAVRRPDPPGWEGILHQYVTYYTALSSSEKKRFRDMMKVFLDEVVITGIRTDVDEVTRVLVAASAIIPVFGFEDWEYSGLGEVLIYPNSFNEEYDSSGGQDARILGMVGDAHLSGTMIFSKSALIAGFQIDSDKRNVGIHEFAHLVDKQDGGIDGTPPTIKPEVYRPWIQWVGNELKREGSFGDIDDYAYTNEAEYFAVLSEYFFENPDQLQRKHPRLYEMLQSMYHQNTSRRLGGKRRPRRRVQRNDPCPCGSKKKFKHCCLKTRRS